ncbi:hypothetical protein [Brevundimonas mediterranea]|uniref:Uncharacterized protein n=1 Tax=Brevundimonas mediterranea TaxID=74329 RepID=A0A7W6A1C0_9CAUL|nr:hypothetical protein [Brevundimonas mediterranea]MBB3870844.1 hypothetical protein [Brevundimonas mediterranea]
MKHWSAAALIMLLGGCLPNEKPPPIAEGMEVSIANEEWPPRLAQRFPLGSSEAELVTTLSSQGFIIDQSKRTAKAEWSSGVCRNELDVVWQTDDVGQLVSVGGRYFPVCP